MAKKTLKIRSGVSYLVTRAGNKIPVKADEVILPENEMGLIRFTNDGETVGMAFASQVSAWWTDPAD